MNIVIDFDSTIISEESLEILFRFALKNNPKRNEIVAAVTDITEQGMRGEISFSESLATRIGILSTNREVIDEVVQYLKKHVSKSFKKNINNILENHILHIVSGGFKEIIDPILADYGINPENIYANRFIMDEKGQITGVDRSIPLAKDYGKVKTVRELNLLGRTIMIGDGYTDYEVKKAGLVSEFVYYAEFTNREEISQKANRIIKGFDEIEDNNMFLFGLGSVWKFFAQRMMG